MNLTRATKWCWMVVTVTTGLVWAGEPAGHPSRLTADKLPETVDSIQCECCNCLVETIDEGEVSYYRYGNPGFLGLTAVIHNPRSWAGFWQQHTAGNIPPPPLPRVDFRALDRPRRNPGNAKQLLWSIHQDRRRAPLWGGRRGQNHQ